jgi:hypothetical protein
VAGIISSAGAGIIAAVLPVTIGGNRNIIDPLEI